MVRIELCGEMKLVTIPAVSLALPHTCRLIDTKLGKPLCNEVKILIIAGPPNR